MTIEEDVAELYKQAEESDSEDYNPKDMDNAVKATKLQKTLVDSWGMDPSKARDVAEGVVEDMPDYQPTGWSLGNMALNALKGGVGGGLLSGLGSYAMSGGDTTAGLVGGAVGGLGGLGVGALAPELSRTLQGPAPGFARSGATQGASLLGGVIGAVGAAHPAERRAKIRDRIQQAMKA